MEKLIKKQNPNIRSMIYHIRGKYVMLDSDLALLYGYEPKRLNEQVQRNIERFPEDFMFKLTREEEENLKSQFATSSYTKLDHGGKRKPSTVFTEQGVYALSGILKGPLATIMSIHLIRTFKELKDFYNENNNLLDRVIDLEVTSKNIDNSLIEYKNDTNSKFDEIFTYISKHKKIKEKIFYKGQIYESYSLIVDLIRSANKQIILIDNYINKDTLDILVNKNENVSINIYTSLLSIIKSLSWYSSVL